LVYWVIWVFQMLPHCILQLKNTHEYHHQSVGNHQWFKPVILATEGAEIRRTAVQSQPGQISSWDPISKIPNTKRAGGVPQSVGPEFKARYYKKKKKLSTDTVYWFPWSHRLIS
jgi:hypothetical protein